MSINTLEQLIKARVQKELDIKAIHAKYQKERNMG